MQHAITSLTPHGQMHQLDNKKKLDNIRRGAKDELKYHLKTGHMKFLSLEMDSVQMPHSIQLIHTERYLLQKLAVALHLGFMTHTYIIVCHILYDIRHSLSLILRRKKRLEKKILKYF